MKVAVIDNDRHFQYSFRKKIDEFNVSKKCDDIDVDFFTDSIDFGKSNLKKYKIIITNIQLPTVQGLQLIHSIKEKTDAYFALLIPEHKNEYEEILQDERIVSMFNKNEPIRLIINWLKFMQSRVAIYECHNKIESEYTKCIDHINNIKK